MEWLNPPFGSFDDFGNAMLLLYIMSTGDGWEDVNVTASSPPRSTAPLGVAAASVGLGGKSGSHLSSAAAMM